MSDHLIPRVTKPGACVKSYQLPLFSSGSKPVTHHSKALPKQIRGNRDKVWRDTSYYGVSSDYRILTKGLFTKRFDYIRDFLKFVLGLSIAEREFTLRLLCLWAHYGKCYPKIAQLCEEPGCSKATAFRALRKLKEVGLIEVIQRFLTPYRRQISNLYLLHGLLLLIARYLAENGTHFWEKWLEPYLQLPGTAFWALALAAARKADSEGCLILPTLYPSLSLR